MAISWMSAFGHGVEIGCSRQPSSDATVGVTRKIRACRDPRDDKFLELAVAGGADVIVTGDSDLLALGPFQSIAIVTPARFLTLRPE